MRRLPFFPRRTAKLEGARGSALEQARARLVLLSGAFAVVFILIAVRVFDLSVIQGSLHPIESADANAPTAPAPRADITDRNGVLLATSLQTASLYADPAQIQDKKSIAAALAKILPDMKEADALDRLKRPGHFVWLRRNLTPSQEFNVLKLGEPGLQFRTELRRIYPQGPLAAHIVGYTDIDGHGLAGIERSFNKPLTTSDDPVKLTLDIRLQHILRREIQTAIQDFTADAGAGVIMDVTNGQVLAAVSLPDFDPHNPPACPKGENPQDCPMFNRVTLGTYELGSTFKIFTLAALLDILNPPLSTTYDATAPLQVGGRFKISDFEPESRPLTVPEVFMVSSNIGAALMAKSIGIPRMTAFWGKMGLLKPQTLDIDEVGRPQFPAHWQEVNIMTGAFGHGISVTPLQLVTGAASIANGGKLLQPHFVIDDNQKDDDTGDKVISAATAHRMRELLRLVVTDGTGGNANVPGYDVGGKTGTAEKPGPHGYEKKHMISSFLGIFPVDNPKYAVYIMVDEPHGNAKSKGYSTGGWVAAPAVARVINSMAAILGLRPDTIEPDLTAPLRPYVHTQKKEGGGAAY